MHVDVFLDSADSLGAFGLELEVTGGSAGMLVLSGITVDTERSDYVFYEQGAITGTNKAANRVGASMNDGTFVGSSCEGDADGDGLDGACGDPCPLDNPDDTDGDGVCDSNDPCPFDNPDDSDGDGICDSADVCPGFDDTLDTDGDTIPDCQDQCPGANDALYAPECAVAIPTTTVWGLVVLALSLLAVLKAHTILRRSMNGNVP